MWVSEATVSGTIGGGALEHRAIARARDMLAADEDRAAMELPLGPALNQCCGGFVRLSLTRGYPPRGTDHRLSAGALRWWPRRSGAGARA